jgi:thiosulfate reductase cytochrome b subunit
MELRAKHPLWLRISHWLNVPALLLLVWSGILIYWANDAYPPFFPEWFYETFGIGHRLAEGMAIHFTASWVFVLNTAFYLLASFATRHWRELWPGRGTWRLLLPTILHDLHLRQAPVARGKYNAAQRVAYTGVALLFVLEVLTGLAIYKPVQLSALLWPFGGYEGARFVHFVVMLLLVAFAFLHVLQVARAGWNHFRAMVAGYEVIHDEE